MRLTLLVALLVSPSLGAGSEAGEVESAADYTEHVGKTWGASMFGCFKWRNKAEIQQACDAEERCGGYTMSKGDWAKKKAVFDVEPDTIYGESFVPGCLMVFTEGHPEKESENSLYYTKGGHVVHEDDKNHVWSGFEMDRMDRLYTNKDTITFDVKWRYDEDGTCPGCVEQLYIGFAGEVARCLWTGNPDKFWHDVSDVQTSYVTLNVPAGGGDLVACGSWMYSCKSDQVCTVVVGHVAKGDSPGPGTGGSTEKVPGEVPADVQTWHLCGELGGPKKKTCLAVPGCNWKKKKCVQDKRFMKELHKNCKKVRKDIAGCKGTLGCKVVYRKNGKKMKKCVVDLGEDTG